MAGHMGDRTKKVLNVLVVLTDPVRNLLFVEGSVPGAADRIVTITHGRRPALRNFAPPTLPGGALDEDDDEEASAESAESADSPDSEDSPDSPDTADGESEETTAEESASEESEDDEGEAAEAPATEGEARP